MTLIELLTAMIISVLLIGTAFSTFWVSTQSWDKAKRRTEMIRQLEGAADVLTRHFRSIQPPFLQSNYTFVAINDGDEIEQWDSVAFLSGANQRFPRQLAFADLCEVEFFVETPTSGDSRYAPTTSDSELEPGLWMRIDPTPDDDIESGGYVLQLGDLVTSLDFRFFDGYEWLEEWFYDSEVPEAVEFSLTVSDPMERENPMTYTRLVRIPLAHAVNEGALEATGGSGETTEPEPTTPEPTNEPAEESTGEGGGGPEA